MLAALCWRSACPAPERKGFGSFLIERAVQGGGRKSTLEFRSTGLICSIEMPLKCGLSRRYLDSCALVVLGGAGKGARRNTDAPPQIFLQAWSFELSIGAHTLIAPRSVVGQTQKSRADLDRSGSRPIAAKRWPPALVGGLV